MKRFGYVFASTALAVFSVCLVCAGWAGPAYAKDSGDENVVPVIRWACFMCQKEFWTFDPDDIAGSSRPDHKSHNYQQSNWVMLTDRSRAVPKCERAPDGAHFFEKKQNMNTSPFRVAQLRNSFIVLKNGGGTIKAKVLPWKCALCDKEGVCFSGDDMDLYESTAFRDRLRIYSLQNMSQLEACRGRILGNSIQSHILVSKNSPGDTRSITIAENVSKMWVSN